MKEIDEMEEVLQVLQGDHNRVTRRIFSWKRYMGARSDLRMLWDLEKKRNSRVDLEVITATSNSKRVVMVRVQVRFGFSSTFGGTSYRMVGPDGEWRRGFHTCLRDLYKEACVLEAQALLKGYA